MKLLELLVQEKVQWPEGALWAVQDFDKELRFLETESQPRIPAYSASGGVWYHPGQQHAAVMELPARASDWDTKVISKQEYNAAVAAAGYMCPGDASCTDQGCPHHYASDVVAESRPAHAHVRDWYIDLAPVIAAAAEGKVVQYSGASGTWYDCQGTFYYPNMYRVKPDEPKTIKVNGFDVPEPMREAPLRRVKFYIPAMTVRDLYVINSWVGSEYDRRALKLGVAHSTAEAAIAHAKAMLGIDPYAGEDADDEHP